MSASTKHTLQTYLRRLTNLSGNNRSLVLLRLHAEQLIDVHEFSFLNGDRSFEIINALIAGKNKKLCQVLDSRVEANNESSKKLKRLQRIDRFIFEERGSNDLHIGWPFVHGKFADGSIVRCPLLFFPVSIVQEGQHWVLQPRQDAGISFNKSFLLAFSFFNAVKLDEELIDTSFDDFSSDSTVFRTQLYQLLKDKVELNFNPDNFRDELVPFQEFKKEGFEETHRNGELKLFPEAVLGIFPQAGSQLVPDYLHLIETNSITDLEEFFLKKNTFDDREGISSHNIQQRPIKEEKLFTPFILDAYQENAIKAIKNGQSVVVQGPPGTGKSQLICNLLSDAIASGKKALLVCQKRAALDVVYDRLRDMGVGDFLGLVHDFRNDRKEIFTAIDNQIGRIEEYKARNRNIDVIHTERKFFQLCRKIDQLTEELEEFKHALFDDKECGISVKELYLTSDPHHASINIKQEYQFFSFPELNEFIRKLKIYSNYASWFDAEDYPWRERKSFASFRLGDEKEIGHAVSDIPVYLKQLSEKTEKLIGVKLGLEEAESLHLKEDDVLGMIASLKDEDTYRFFQTMISEKDDETSMLWLANVERVSLSCFDGENPESTVTNDQLGKFQDVLQYRMRARKNFIRLMRWELFSDDKFLVKRVLVANGLSYNKIGLNVLEQRIDNRLNLEHHLTSLKDKNWLIELPVDYKKKSLQAWFEKQKFAIRAKIIFNTLREIKEGINVQMYSRKEFISMLHELLSIVKTTPEKKASWLVHLSAYQVRQLSEDAGLVSLYTKTLRKDFDNICEYDKLKEELSLIEKSVLVKLNSHLKEWDAKQIETLFQNSLRLAWIDHIETKYPILRSVSTMKMEEIEHELQYSVAEKQKLSKEILMVRAREKVYDALEYNRLNNLVTYRDLQHQVSKKKKVWPLRKVISEFQNEVFQLIPCWMASPESVSAIFPMTELFDLVIFDEASQCFAERGVPAMYRGKQILVAGDDKQLRPSELYHVRWDGDEENPDLEIDSLLELTERYLPTVHLQGHYRSQSVELIDFSNTFFYDGRLQLLPDRHIFNQHQPAIQYRKVEGVWESQTNVIEATAVVECVMRMLREQPSKTIGVVTFNAPQQMLVLDLLEAEAMKAGQTIPSSLFVKNIENVQGDEKDVIIFSVGYAPDKKGKMMMQFGSLNAAGGENRLNVAVTRAREKIILFTSIWPEQLKIEDIKNDGPKLLRKYLEYVRQVDRKEFKLEQIVLQQNSNWYLSNRLQQWAEDRLKEYSFENHALPFADVPVRQRNQYVGIILTDDGRYFSSLSPKDTYAYTPALLTQKNWKHHRVYSRNLWKDREKMERELMIFIGSQEDQKG
ncbi:MAG: AAA domain-containing protein [Chryseolinea sp.]